MNNNETRSYDITYYLGKPLRLRIAPYLANEIVSFLLHLQRFEIPNFRLVAFCCIACKIIVLVPVLQPAECYATLQFFILEMLLSTLLVSVAIERRMMLNIY